MLIFLTVLRKLPHTEHTTLHAMTPQTHNEQIKSYSPSTSDPVGVSKASNNGVKLFRWFQAVGYLDIIQLANQHSQWFTCLQCGRNQSPYIPFTLQSSVLY